MRYIMLPHSSRKKRRKKIYVAGSKSLWVEFDGNCPESPPEGVPAPSIRIKSSKPGHEHWYWLCDSRLEVPDIERINKSLAYSLGADISGWDSTQILRPPETFNHKRQETVEVISLGNKRNSLDTFALLEVPPSADLIENFGEIPEIDEVMSRFKWKATVYQLFKSGVPDGNSGTSKGRGLGLMALGYHLAEMQMTNEEMLSVLLNADTRWGKFAGRSDQIQRLSEIISIARGKYPFTGVSSVGKMESYGLLTLLNTPIELDWVWNSYLQTEGNFLLVGPPQVGKSQFSLDFAQRAALGQNFLDREIKTPRRIGFVSLEMGLVDLKYFVQIQSQTFKEDELQLLEENLKFLPLGEPLYLSQKSEQEKLEDWIFDEQLDGVIIDSLGSTTDDLSGESEVKTVLDFNDKLRQRHNVFTWYVHHNRKSSGNNKKPNKLDDVYGSRYITARATTVYFLWENTDGNSIQGIPLKIRLAPRQQPVTIFRDGKLHFTLMNSGITMVKKKKGPVDDSAEKESGIKPTSTEGVSGIKAPGII
jgi:hypothetical protein